MVPILINRKDVVTFILGNLPFAHFLKCICFENFVPGFEEDRPKDSEK